MPEQSFIRKALLELFKRGQMQVNAWTLDRHGTLKHLASLPLRIVPLLRSILEHVMISLIPSSIVHKSDLPFTVEETLRLRIDPTLRPYLCHRQPHRADIVSSLQLHFDHLLITYITLIVLTDK